MHYLSDFSCARTTLTLPDGAMDCASGAKRLAISSAYSVATCSF